MDKSDVKVHENHSDTSSVITMKEYAPSEYPSSEPPPAYIKPRSNALRIAKLAAFTVIVSSIILGGFILAASWIQANTARNLDLTLNQELFDDLHPSYEHLVANEVLPEQQHNSVDQSESKTEASDENKVTQNAEKILEKINQSNDEGLVPPPPPLSVPMKAEEKRVMDMDEIANILMQKNIKGNVNCIVEKRRNEELVDHAPMFLNLPTAHLPFGMNITTPPRLQHLTGERMIVICKGDEDEEKESSVEEGENDKAEEIQQIVFPLPNNLISHIQQIPQIIPLSSILQHLQLQQQVRPFAMQQQLPMQPVQVQQLPLQQIQVQQIPVQQIPVQQIPVQQIPFQQLPVQQIQLQHVPPQVLQIPIQRLNAPQFQPQQPQIPQQLLQQPVPQPQQIIFRHQMIPEQQQRPQQPPQQQIFFPQKVFAPQPNVPAMNNQPNLPVLPEIVPLKEVSVNQNRIPVNHVFHHRVPINPMAVSDIPISRMQITHLPLRAEPQIKEEPVPVHHLMPPQPQQQQVENFRQEGPRFNERPIQIFPPQPNQVKQFPVEVNDPGVLRVPAPLAQESREQFPIPLRPNRVFLNNLVENREPEFAGENRAFRPLTVDVRPRGQRREPFLPEISRIIPLNFERRPMDSGRRIRFPDMVESEPPRENRMPIITEITKIIPIRLEKEETEINEVPVNQPKNVDVSEIKLEKIPPRPFPIPINAILDMIFKGIRPLMGNREHSFPVPIDIKIEKIENKPLGLMDPPFLKKFEIVKKESQNSMEDEDSQNSQMDEKNDSEENDEDEKEIVEAKVKRVEVFDNDNENGHPIPVPADAQDPQVFKVEDQGKQFSETNNEQSSFEDQAFLPNGQGRGARVFPIPQVFPIRPKEAEIFSVSDAKSEKNADNVEVPVESSVAVTNSAETEAEKTESETADNRQGRFLDFQNPFINLFPISNKAVDSASEARSSLKLLPVPEGDEKAAKPAEGEANGEETRPHFVQPRSV